MKLAENIDKYDVLVTILMWLGGMIMFFFGDFIAGAILTLAAVLWTGLATMRAQIEALKGAVDV